MRGVYRLWGGWLGCALAIPMLLAGAFASLPAAAAALQAQAAATPATPAEWRAAAREDVEGAYAAFREHHPGMFDPNNPSFPDQLRRARDAALAFAERIDDAEGHMRSLALFSAGLADGHALAVAIYNGTDTGIWTGFTTVWRGEALQVLDPGESGPPRGAALLGCDGRGARDLIRESAFWFYGRPDEAGQWWVSAPDFFDRARSRYATLPRECTFRHPDGREGVHRIEWRPLTREMFTARLEAGRRDPIGLTEPRPGIHRISLSSFSPDDEGRTAYDRLFAELEASAQRIAAGRAIVLDLRRNAGGSSSWSEAVAERLWGETAVGSAQAEYFRETRIWWLADPANIDHFRSAAERIRAEGRPRDARDMDGTVAGLEAARRRGDRFYIENFGAELAARARSATPRRLPPVYVVVDGNCSSACLDAIDLFTRFPGVKLVGAPTSADTNYLDIRIEPLPSGRGRVVMPTKIWVGRPRGSGEVYRPDILVTDLEWTTAVMLDHVERDLAH